MSYMVDGGTNNRPRFATLEEANACANDYMKRTGVVLAVTSDSREPNAEYIRKEI